MNIRLVAEQLYVLMKQDIKVRASYRMTIILGIVSGLAGLLVYGLLGNSATNSLTQQLYGLSLGSYLVSGVAFSAIITNGPSLFTLHANPGQIEEILVTPTGFRRYLLLSSLLTILTSLGSAAIYFLVTILVLGLAFTYNLPILILVVTLGLLCSIGLGFIGFGLQLVYKQTSILPFLLFTLTGIVGNMIVPPQLLGSLQTVSYLTPQYYFFTGIRVSLGSTGSAGNALSTEQLLATLTLYTFVLLVLGEFVFDRGCKFVKRNGTHRWT